MIDVERGWEDVEGELDQTKTEAGRRTVMIIPELRSHLVKHLMLSGRRGDDLVFGRTPETPFVRSTVRARALRAWTAAKLEPIKPHECRDTFASAMRAALQHGLVYELKDRRHGSACDDAPSKPAIPLLIPFVG